MKEEVPSSTSETKNEQETKSNKEYQSPVIDSFEGVLISSIICSKCEKVPSLLCFAKIQTYQKKDNFFDISISIPDSNSLDALYKARNLENPDKAPIYAPRSGWLSSFSQYIGFSIN